MNAFALVMSQSSTQHRATLDMLGHEQSLILTSMDPWTKNIWSWDSTFWKVFHVEGSMIYTLCLLYIVGINQDDHNNDGKNLENKRRQTNAPVFFRITTFIYDWFLLNLKKKITCKCYTELYWNVSNLSGSTGHHEAHENARRHFAAWKQTVEKEKKRWEGSRRETPRGGGVG